MGLLERACARSVMAQGHVLRIWTYGRVDGFPENAERADAEAVLPESAIVRHVTGSVSLFSNRFRYELQRVGYGTWLDSDVYLLRPIEMERPYLLAEYEPGQINGAVLRLPPDSPILQPLLRPFDERTVPSWLPLRERLAVYKRLVLTGRTGLAAMRWGVAGPYAITALAHKHGLAALAAPPHVYYPAPWQEASWIFDPSIDLDRWVTAETRAIHLWNERIKDRKDADAPVGSFAHRLHREGA